ncbi:hypothetical protein Tco_1539842 [Tanacetum coccineum]
MPWIKFVVAKIDKKWCLCSIFIIAVCCETAALRSGLLNTLRSVVYQSILTAVCPDLFAAVWSDSLDDNLLKPPHGGLVNCLSAVCHYKMAEENVLAPTRTDEQLVPVKARLPIGKGNLLMDLQKKQKNPIFLISNILGKDSKTGVYSFQLDELWFNLNTDLLRKALGITPKDSALPFVPPLASDLIIDFVNNLGYSEELQFVSKMQDLLTQTPSSSNVVGCCHRNQYRLCRTYLGRFRAVKNFFSDMANLKVPTKKTKPPVIPYCRFTKLIIYYLGKYYEKYLEMAARKPCQPTTMTGKVKKKKKAPKAGKSTQPAPEKQPKPAKKKTSKPTPSKKIRKGKRSDHLVDEEDEEPQPASELQVEDDEYNL